MKTIAIKPNPAKTIPSEKPNHILEKQLRSNVLRTSDPMENNLGLTPKIDFTTTASKSVEKS